MLTQILSMNLQDLKWTKNVKRDDGDWAYKKFKASDLFKLAWKDDYANASKPKKDDLILLRQQGFVTHLVKILDYKPEHETGKGDWDIYRIAEVLWNIDFDIFPVSAKADTMFGYSQVLKYRGGDVMELAALPTFQEHWDNKGGLKVFQAHVRNFLV